LGGTLDVVLLGGFIPPPGASFPILQYGSHTGNFAATVGDFSTAQFGATGLTIQVQAGSIGQATGEGRLDPSRRFAFEVLGFSGNLQYSDQQHGIRLESRSITAFRIAGDGRHASFSGTANVNGEMGYTFVVDIVAGAEGKGRFRIRIYQDAALYYD